MNFRVGAFLFLLLTARAAFSQPLPDRQPIVGRIVDGESKPLAGAVISIRRQNRNGSYAFWGATTATDARGEFRFSHAETGRYFLDATRAGFAPLHNQAIDWNLNGAPLQLQLGRLVTLQLRVSRPDSTLAVKTPVWLRLRPLGNPAQTTRRALSDENGQVRFAGLAPAAYALFLASDNGFFLQNELTLRADVALDIALQKGGSIRASVRQSGAPTRGLGGALLSLIPQNSTDMSHDTAILAAQGERLALISRDGDGTIELPHIPSGRYLARLSLPHHATGEPQAVEIAAGQSVELSWDLPAKPAASLTMQLRSSQAGQSVRGEVALRFLPINADGTLADEEVSNEVPWTIGANRERRALVDQQGQITIFPLRAGRYRVFVAPRALGFDLENGPAEAASVDVLVPAESARATLTLKTSSP